MQANTIWKQLYTSSARSSSIISSDLIPAMTPMSEKLFPWKYYAARITDALDELNKEVKNCSVCSRNGSENRSRA